MIRDFQKSKVYKWENAAVSPKDVRKVPFEQIQGLVDYIWAAEGLSHPPIVEFMHAGDKHSGKGCREFVSFPETGAKTWIVIHELAHAMNADIDADNHSENSDRHGPNFVGIYVDLLTKYLKIDMMYLLGSVRAHGVKINHGARPMMR